MTKRIIKCLLHKRRYPPVKRYITLKHGTGNSLHEATFYEFPTMTISDGDTKRYSYYEYDGGCVFIEYSRLNSVLSNSLLFERGYIFTNACKILPILCEPRSTYSIKTVTGEIKNYFIIQYLNKERGMLDKIHTPYLLKVFNENENKYEYEKLNRWDVWHVYPNRAF